METPRTANCDEIENLLPPYVDGEAESADRAVVSRHLEACPRCRARAQAERTAREVLCTRRPVLAATAPQSLRERCLATSRRSTSALRRASLSAAAALVLAVAGAALYVVTFRTEALAASIAADHLKCFTFVDTAASADAEAAAREWKRSRGWTLTVVPGAPAERLAFIGVRRCLSTEGMAAHLMYTSEGRPLSVFVWPRPDVADRNVEVLGQKAVIWSSPDRMYAVVGREPADRMVRVTAYLRQGTK